MPSGIVTSAIKAARVVQLGVGLAVGAEGEGVRVGVAGTGVGVGGGVVTRAATVGIGASVGTEEAGTVDVPLRQPARQIARVMMRLCLIQWYIMR